MIEPVIGIWSKLEVKKEWSRFSVNFLDNFDFVIPFGETHQLESVGLSYEGLRKLYESYNLIRFNQDGLILDYHGVEGH